MTESRKISERLFFEATSFGKDVKIYRQVNFDGNDLTEIVRKVKEIKKEYGAKYSRIFLDKVREYEHYGDGSWDVWYWMGERLETEEEVKLRCIDTKLQAKNNEESDRALLEKLKQKYGE